jgi:hypothetical protein
MKKETFFGIGFLLFLFCTPIILSLVFKPSKPNREAKYVYEYYINQESVSNGAHFIVTSIDTTYADRELGSATLIEVTLSRQ